MSWSYALFFAQNVVLPWAVVAALIGAVILVVRNFVPAPPPAVGAPVPPDRIRQGGRALFWGGIGTFMVVLVAGYILAFLGNTGVYGTPTADSIRRAERFAEQKLRDQKRAEASVTAGSKAITDIKSSIIAYNTKRDDFLFAVADLDD